MGAILGSNEGAPKGGAREGSPGDVQAPLALLAYCCASISMTIMNKYVLSSHKFHLNFFLLLVQSTVCILFLSLCKTARMLKYRSVNRRDAAQWFPVSLLLVAMIYTGSKSIQHLTVAMFTVFKNVTIVCIALGEQRLFAAKITRLMWTAFGLIIASSVVGGANDLAFNLGGYLWMTTNCAVSAAYILYMRLTIRKVQFAEFDSVYYNSILSIPVLALLTVFGEDWGQFYDDYFNGGPLEGQRGALFTGIIASSFCAFAISYTTAWSMRVSSSTTYSMVGALNKLPIAISGLLFFSAERKVTNVGNVLSIIIAFSSGIMYSIAQIRERRRKAHEELTSTTIIPMKQLRDSTSALR